MKHIILCILSTLAAFGQAQTPLKVFQSAGSLTGQVWLQERRTNGTNVVKLEAPQSIAADFSLILPNADGAAGRCLKTDGSGALGWRACGETYDVTTYGAACDNSTDDTTAIQAAITAAEAAGGGTVQFPLGTCLVTTVTVTGNFIGLAGKHRNASVLKGTANSSIVRINTDGSDMYFFSARSMTVQGNTGASTAAFEVYGPNNFDRSVFEDLYIVDVRRGFWAQNTGYIAWFSYRGNYCDTVSVSGGTCIDVSSTTGANQSVIANNMFANHATGVGVKYRGTLFGDNTVTGNNSEQGNYFMDLDCGPVCAYGANWIITGNKIDNTAIAPFYFNNIQASTVAFNRILGGVIDTVSVNGTSDQLILGAYYETGLKSLKTDESWGLGAFASGRLRLGEIDVNLSGSTNGISVKDDDESVGIALGQNSSYNVGLQWVYDATPANGYGLLYTFGNNNSLAYRAKTHSFETDGAGRWEISQTGMVLPITTDSYDIGSLTGTKRVRAIYPKIIDTALAGGTGDYVQTRKLQLFDNTGSTASAAFWDLNVVMSGAGAGQTSYFYLRDNSGTNVFKSERVIGGAAVDRTYWYTDLMPDTDLGQSLGSATKRWQIGWMNQLGTATEPVGVYGTAGSFSSTLTSATVNATGSPAYQVGGNTVIDASRNATFQGLTVLTTVSSPLIPTTTNIYDNGGSSARWATTYTTGLNVAGVMTLASTVTGDLIPTTNNTAVVGSGSNYWNQMRSQDFYVENSGRIRPTTTNTGSVGISTARFSKAWFTDLDITGTITPPSGTAFTGTKTVRASGGASDCTLTFSSGIMTGGTC